MFSLDSCKICVLLIYVCMFYVFIYLFKFIFYKIMELSSWFMCEWLDIVINLVKYNYYAINILWLFYQIYNKILQKSNRIKIVYNKYVYCNR